MPEYVFRSNGNYLGFISNGNLFSRDGEYLGWTEGDLVWDSNGHFRGKITIISSRNYILKNAYLIPPIPKVPRVPPSFQVPPAPPLNAAPIILPIGLKDSF